MFKKFNENKLSNLFFKKLLIIKLNIIIFKIWYINKNNFIYYINLIIIFTIKIKLLIIHNGKIKLFIKYDLLGVTSYLLILFYNNWLKINGKHITFITNRFGDIFILSKIIYFINKNILNFKIFLFLIGKFTKRKIYPFNSWLPYKIKKPTPTRKLVHSSTLVKKGLFLIIIYYQYFLIFSYYIMFIKLITCFLKSKLKIIEIDKKKIVKFSTLKQLGFIKFSIKLGFKKIKIKHILKHKFFKRCIFIQIGKFINYSFGNQDIRLYNNKNIVSIKKSKILKIKSLSLIGIIFLKGKKRKELILKNKNKNFLNLFLLLKLFLIIILTKFYSLRLINLFLNNSFNKIKKNIKLLPKKFLKLKGIKKIKWINKNIFIIIKKIIKKEEYFLFLKIKSVIFFIFNFSFFKNKMFSDFLFFTFKSNFNNLIYFKYFKNKNNFNKFNLLFFNLNNILIIITFLFFLL